MCARARPERGVGGGPSPPDLTPRPPPRAPAARLTRARPTPLLLLRRCPVLPSPSPVPAGHSAGPPPRRAGGPGPGTRGPSPLLPGCLYPEASSAAAAAAASCAGTLRRPGAAPGGPPHSCPASAPAPAPSPDTPRPPPRVPPRTRGRGVQTQSRGRGGGPGCAFAGRRGSKGRPGPGDREGADPGGTRPVPAGPSPAPRKQSLGPGSGALLSLWEGLRRGAGRPRRPPAPSSPRPCAG